MEWVEYKLVLGEVVDPLGISWYIFKEEREKGCGIPLLSKAHKSFLKKIFTLGHIRLSLVYTLPE